jgi:hypothetical protein
MFTGYTSSVARCSGRDLRQSRRIPISLDDPSLQGGNPILLIADNQRAERADRTAGSDDAAQNIEPTPGRRSRIRIGAVPILANGIGGRKPKRCLNRRGRGGFPRSR